MKMKHSLTQKGCYGLLLLLLGLGGGAASWAYAPETDVLNAKGYSPELITLLNGQRTRQEWRNESPTTLTPRERFFHNILYSNWTGSIHEFGRTLISPND